ncbi:acetyl-CoA carboxylase biotin carboxylase subunit family protein [Streptomyces sp. NPDC097595]|uniref:ATP-grasp domain-containing protein n=1 Tax=Streptomyces sp. NPDC097595 TaxID=3366090 RepID=UPI003803DD7F
MHILILNRYSDAFADYARYVDHRAHTVSYVTVSGHVPMIPAHSRGHVEVVDSLTGTETVLRAAGRCHRAAGAFDAVLAMSEFDLLTAAAVREAFAAPGPDIHSTLRFRDKAVMKEAVAKAGLRVPRFEPVRSLADVAAFARTCPGPVVVKPRTGAASAGVTVLPAGAEPAPGLLGPPAEEYEAEEFCAGPIWHIDGLRYRGETTCRFASRYIGTCHGFAQGEPLGSVLHRDGTAERLADFSDDCLDALGLTDGPFHLEAVQHEEGPVFLEVGARVGGGEIPFVLQEVYGLDLFREWVRVLLGARPAGPVAAAAATEHVGFLMLPEPVGHTLVSRTGLVGRIPHLYAEELPDPGHRFDGKGGYEHILGRFRYRAASAESVERAIEDTLTAYHYELTGTR